MIRLTDEGYTDDEDTTAVLFHSASAMTAILNRYDQSVNGFSMQEREELVYKLLASMPRSQIARVHRRIAPCVQVDIVGTLPTELALHILSYLAYQALLKCALVSARWRALADDPTLWRRLCAARGWAWRWPAHTFREPAVESLEEDAQEEFDDEGMGDDEDLEGEGDEGAVYAVQSPSGALLEQDSGFASQLGMASTSTEVFGLPPSPRLAVMPTRRATFKLHGSPSCPRAGSSKPPAYPHAQRRSRSRTPRHVLPARPAYRHSAPCALPGVHAAARADYKLLHQTHVLLRNRLLHGTYRFRTLQTRGAPHAHGSIIYCLQLHTYPTAADTFGGAGYEAAYGGHGGYAGRAGRQVLFTGSKDKTIREWNLSTGTVERVFDGVHTGSVLSLCAHGDYIASGGSDWRVCVWDLRDGSLVRTLMDHVDSVLCVRFNERWMVSCSKDRTVRMYTFPDLKEHQVLGTHRAAVNAVAIAGDLVVSASGDKSIRLWDANTGDMLRSFEGHHTRGIASIDFHPPHILSGSSDKHIRLFDVRTRRGWSTCAEFHNPPPACATGICEACGGLFREGERTRAGPIAGPGEGALGVGVGSSRRASMVRDMHGDLVRSVALGQEFVVSGSYDQSIKVWDRETGTLVADLTGGHEGRVFCVGSDYTKIVSCGEDQKICIWDLAYGIDTSFIKL